MMDPEEGTAQLEILWKLCSEQRQLDANCPGAEKTGPVQKLHRNKVGKKYSGVMTHKKKKRNVGAKLIEIWS